MNISFVLLPALCLSSTLVTSALPLDVTAPPNPGLIAAVHSTSNYLEEGTAFGDFEEFYPGIFPDARWSRTIREIGSNGLFEARYAVFEGRAHRSPHPQTLNILLFRPGSLRGTGSVAFSAPWTFGAGAHPHFGPARPQATEADVALQAVQDALLGAQLFVANSNQYTFVGDDEAVSFTGQLPASFSDVGESGGMESRRVRIGLHLSGEGRADLVLDHTPLLMHLATPERFRTRIILASDVALFQLRYPTVETPEALEQWAWTNQLPQLVQVTLALNKGRGAKVQACLASRIIQLPSTAVTPELQALQSFPREADTNRPPSRLPVNPDALEHLGSSAAIEPWGPRADATEHLRKNPRNPDAAVTEMELEWMARSGVELAKYVLDLESGSGSFSSVDSLKQRWAGGPGQPGSIEAQIPLDRFAIGCGVISVRIEDLERRFNLNVADQIILRQALQLNGADSGQFEPLVDAILDWRDSDEIPRSAGVEDSYYLSMPVPYGARDGAFDDLSELLWVKGVTPEIFYGAAAVPPAARPGWRDMFTAVSTRLMNINTVSAAVLQLLPEIDSNLAQAIVEARRGPDGRDGTIDDIPYRTPSEIAARVPFVSPALVGHMLRYFGVRSFVFEVTITSEAHGATRQYAALIARKGHRDIQVLKMRKL